MDTLQGVDQEPDTPGPRVAVRPSAASLLWAELRDYRQRRETWEKDLYRLVQADRDLQARHWQLVLHAVEVAAVLELHESRTALLPAVGEGPTFDERMAHLERTLLDAGLARAGGCRRRAAALLGLLPTTLCEKLKRLGLAHRPDRLAS